MARSPSTTDDVEAAFAAVGEDQVAEILDGELHVQPRPRPLHARAASQLASVLDAIWGRGGPPGGWILLIEPEIHVGRRPDKLVPDIAGWRAGRLPDEVFAPDAPAGIRIVPDWVCEVLSTSTARIDRGKKMRIYRRERVPHVWLVTPAEETVEVYRLAGDLYALVDTYEGDDPVRAEPFDAFELPLARLWGR